MDTDIDPENELLQLAVEELVRAALRTPLREPILTAVESTSEERVEVVVPEESGGAAITEGIDEGAGAEGSASGAEDAGSESSGRGPVAKATRGLVVSALSFAVLYVALRRLTGDDGA